MGSQIVALSARRKMDLLWKPFSHLVANFVDVGGFVVQVELARRG